MELIFNNDFSPKHDEYEQHFTTLLAKGLKALNHSDNVIVEVNLVDDESIKVLNATYRNIDKATDVLSFAFNDDVVGETKIKNMPFTDLGTIVISVDKAIEQSARYGHTFEREMSFLFIHGLLHLMGYDHHDPQQEEVMFALQDAIIGKRKEQ